MNEEVLAHWGTVATNKKKKVKHMIGTEQEFFVNKNGTCYWRNRNEIMTSRDEYRMRGIRDRVLRRLFVPKAGKRRAEEKNYAVRSFLICIVH